MHFVNLGRSALNVSRLCLGCMTYGDPVPGQHEWTLGEDESRPYIRQALESGINFFDTANGYSARTSELFLGRALKQYARRDEVVIATKCFLPWRLAPNTGGLSRKAIFHAVDDSLQRLRTDYIDLYQIHRWDGNCSIEETMEALHDVIKAGKVRYIGASSMYAWQFSKAQYVADLRGWTRFISMQNQVNLLYREEEREMLPLCVDMGVGVIPWSPLARGLLARRWGEATDRSGSDPVSRLLYSATAEQDRKIVEAVAEVAAQRGVPLAQIALAWVLQRIGITAPIVGASKPGHLEDSLAALNILLTRDEIVRLEHNYIPHPVAGLEMPVRPNLEVTVSEAAKAPG